MAVRWWFLLFLLLVPRLMADDISLVRVGENWSYLCGSNAPSSPITAWRQPGFDDSGWLCGMSGFSTAFYADYREATLWPDATAYRSVFLRKTFTVADPDSVKWLVLRLDYDDGFVAYLNGQEIVRRGLTNDPVNFDDPATVHPGGAAEDFNVSGSISLLQQGLNVLAIEVHAAITNEPGLTNSMRLVPELLANFQRGPFVQNATTNSIQMIWRTPIATDGTVKYGTTPALDFEVDDTTRTTNHVVTLTDLQPDTQYFYCVRSSSRAVAAVSPTNSFRTLKTAGDVSFLVIGDAGLGSVAAHRVASTMRQVGGDLVMHVGDVVYPNFTFGLEDTRCLSVYGQQMRSVPFFFTMGNHEVDGGALGVAYFATFYLPTNSVFGTEHFYSFDHGDGHFVVLFLPTLFSFPGSDQFTQYQLYEGSAQYQWLTNDLAASSKNWKFLFLHHPLATSGSHRDDYPASTWQNLQNMLLPVARQYGVQMIFSGHDHDYERFNPVRSVQLIVTGAGGGTMNGITDARDAASSQFLMVYECTKVSIQGDSLHLQAIDTNALVIDELFIQRVPPAPRTYNSALYTPLVETRPADDGHGNINGQTFDFAGDPIPTYPGDYSNLGQVYVNNDTTNLFIGFKQSMLYSSNNIFLFIESPHLAGVTNLVGLGNGIPDTTQGVDGLDFLENLSFTNFTPSIACLLGDEFADGQFRNFLRAGLPLNIGQGVFYLDSTFSDVSGIRIQQFNRSPQALDPFVTAYPESNANFIEVAIPFDQLGGLRPGETIKIAAVVGLDGYDTNAQTRQLDTSFLGSSMSGSGQSNVVLGALNVQLAPAVLTVKANDLARSYGATNPPLSVSYSGFLSGDDTNILSGAPALISDADTNSPVGAYPIHISPGTLSLNQGLSNYTLSFVDGTLTVTQAVLTANVDGQSRIYGATNPPFSGAVLGAQNQDVITAGYSTAATPASWIGQYAIVPVLAGAALSNYCIVTNLGILTITPAPLTVAADDKTRAYGAPDPVFTGSFTGILNGDALEAAYTTTAGPASPIGAYPIVAAPSGAALVNYSITTNAGVLTITAAPLTVKADDQVRAYGQTNGPLTVSYVGFVNGQGTNILTGMVQLTTPAETNSPVGVYTITLDPGTLNATDTNYTLSFLNGSLTVTQAVLIVTADDQVRGYGATNPPLTFTYAGFVNGQDTNLLSGSPELSTVADTNSAVGQYAIRVSAGTLTNSDTNYSLGLVDGTLTVTQVLLTVNVDNKQRSYGATNPPFSGAIQGIQNNDVLAAEYLTPATPTSPVGDYPILPLLSGAALGNYSVITDAGTLTVTPATLIVAADDQVRAYGQTNPPLSASYTGLMNGESPAVLEGQPLSSTAAETNSPVGLYPIEISRGTLSNSNYLFSFTNGLLTVTQAMLSVRADDQTRLYGDTNPPLTVSYSGFVNGQDTNILSGSVQLSTVADTNSTAGSYPITISPGTLTVADTNYALEFINGVLSITPAESALLLSSSTNPCPNGTEAIFTATIGPLPPAITLPSGVVRFLENDSQFGSAQLSNGVASLSSVLWTVGTNAVRAEYAGDTNFHGSTNSLLQVVIAPCSSAASVLNLVLTETNTFLFSFLGTTNAQYYLLQTTNLGQTSDWAILPDSTNTAIQGVWIYTLTNPLSQGGATTTNPAVRVFRAQAVQPCQ